MPIDTSWLRQMAATQVAADAIEQQHTAERARARIAQALEWTVGDDLAIKLPVTDLTIINENRAQFVFEGVPVTMTLTYPTDSYVAATIFLETSAGKKEVRNRPQFFRAMDWLVKQADSHGAGGG